MYGIIWLLLAVFCLMPAVISQIILKNEVKHEKAGGEKS
jgi:hypothetical protein